MIQNLKQAIAVLRMRKHCREEDVDEAFDWVANLFERRWSETKDLPVWRCVWCGGGGCEDYMLEDAVWLKANPKRRGVMHLRCVEDALGRRLTAADFRPIEMNSALLYFLRRMN